MLQITDNDSFVLFFVALQMRLGLTSFANGQSYGADRSEQYFMNDAADKAQKAADLQAKIQARLSKTPGLVSVPNVFCKICNLYKPM